MLKRLLNFGIIVHKSHCIAPHSGGVAGDPFAVTDPMELAGHAPLC